jgi:hypothetical protein
MNTDSTPLNAQFYFDHADRILKKHGHPQGNSELKFLAKVVFTAIGNHLLTQTMDSFNQIPFDFNFNKAFQTSEKIQTAVIKQDYEDTLRIIDIKNAINGEQQNKTRLTPNKGLTFLHELLDKSDTPEGMAYHAEDLFKSIFGHPHIPAQKEASPAGA